MTAALTASRALVSDGSGNITSSSVTTTELGYVSGVTSAIQTQLGNKVNTSAVGAAGGVASLDGGGKVPVAQLPNSIMEFQGVWDASSNTPTLADGVGNVGDVYRANVAGTQNLGSGNQTFVVGDWVMYDSGGVWRLAHAGADVVLSVNGTAGVVTVNAINQLTGDVTASAASGSEAKATTVAQIQGTTVSGTTGTGNVVFSASPTLTGTISGAAASFSGSVTASNLSGSSSGTNTGDVSLTAVGSSPSANAASLSGQTLTLQPADGTNPGVVTAGAQTIGGNKTFSGSISASNLSGTNSGDITLTAVGSSPDANGATLSGQALTLQPADATHPGVVTTGTQTLAGDKTLSGTTTVGQLIDSGLTASTVPYANASKQLTSSAVTPTELGYVSGVTSAIQTQLNNKAALESGDIARTNFVLADNQASPVNVTGLVFDSGTNLGFEVLCYISRGTATETLHLLGSYGGGVWSMSQSGSGDGSHGIVLSITNAGQVQYTSTNTGSAGAIKFRAWAV